MADELQTGQKTASDYLTAGMSNILEGLSGGASSIEKGLQESTEYNFKAGEMSRNAEIQSLRLKDLWGQESFNEQRESEKGAQLVGNEVAAQAGQGVNVRSQASTNVTNDTSSMTAKDMLQIRNNAFAEAFGIKMQGLQDQGEAIQDKFAASNAKTAGFYGAATTFGSSLLKASADF